MAATFNVELARKTGELIGNEALFKGTTHWNGPGMNTHRSPLGGRNYEYYSRDGVHSARIAEAIVGGVASKGLTCYAKHIFLNDQETYRNIGGGVFTRATEQVIREIYAKPFEAIAKQGHTTGYMSAFNRLGEVNCAVNYAPHYDLSRDEWGFKGIYMTDAWIGSRVPLDLAARAGDDHPPGTGTEFPHVDLEKGTWDATRNCVLVYDGNDTNGTEDTLPSPTHYVSVRKAAQRVLWVYANTGANKNGLVATNAEGNFARQVFWYAPAMNIHRTPYSGRNFEYYSEDGFISGVMAASEIKGATSKGLVCVIKHFAFNDQETNRLGINTFFNEQAAREIYLEPFRRAVEEGKTTALMSSFNRVGCTWAGAHRGLMTEVLRNEWGFVGHAITDMNINRTWMNVKTGLLAGNDVWMSSTTTFYDILVEALPKDADLLAAAREACHRLLYTGVNSAVMNGISAGSRVVSITPWWQITLVTLDIVLGVLAVAGGVMLALTVAAQRKNPTSARD